MKRLRRSLKEGVGEGRGQPRCSLLSSSNEHLRRPRGIIGIELWPQYPTSKLERGQEEK